MNDPSWLSPALAAALPAEGGQVALQGQRFVRRGGILRAEGLLSDTQGQTGEAFGFKWKKRDTFGLARVARARQAVAGAALR